MNFFKILRNRHKLTKDYPDFDKRAIKKKFKECNYNAVQCRLALNNDIIAGCQSILAGRTRGAEYFAPGAPTNDRYEEPDGGELHNLGDDLVNADASSFNATNRRAPWSENPVRKIAAHRES
ncbi:hypothetical protein TSMEX_010090 [Taenia solium]|eukprot:TsM_000493700 transcript=TsM_000493700 gene=TsM_000493700